MNLTTMPGRFPKHLLKNQVLRNDQWGAEPRGVSWKVPWASRFAFVAVIVAVTGTAQDSPAPGGPPRMDRVDAPTPINQAPDSNTQMRMHDQQRKQLNFAAANAEPKKQIADDSAKLLKLATDLEPR